MQPHLIDYERGAAQVEEDAVQEETIMLAWASLGAAVAGLMALAVPIVKFAVEASFNLAGL